MSEELQNMEDYGEGVAYPDSPENIPYTREDLIRDLQLRSTQLKSELKKFVENTRLRKKCKEAWFLTINEAFDPNTILANNADLETPIINKEISKIKLKIPCSKIDTLQPHYTTLETAFDEHYTKWLTRTYGPKRERLLQEFASSVRQRVEHGRMDELEQLPAKKKGFSWFG